MCGCTRVDRITNEVIQDIVKVTPIDDKMRETRLREFDHVRRRNVDTPVRRCERINIPEVRRGRRRLKKSLDKIIRENLKVMGLMEDMA